MALKIFIHWGAGAMITILSAASQKIKKKKPMTKSA
jgi:hypothetical protein